MGDNFLEGQAKSTKKRRAKAAAVINAPKLIIRGDEVVDEFTVDCREGCELSPGEELLCFQNARGDTIDVARGHLNVGKVKQAGGAGSLATELQGEGVGRLRVRSFDHLAGSAQVERVREENSNGHQR
jgi:hypothetical protein